MGLINNIRQVAQSYRTPTVPAKKLPLLPGPAAPTNAVIAQPAMAPHVALNRFLDTTEQKIVDEFNLQAEVLTQACAGLAGVTPSPDLTEQIATKAKQLTKLSAQFDELHELSVLTSHFVFARIWGAVGQKDFHASFRAVQHAMDRLASRLAAADTSTFSDEQKQRWEALSCALAPLRKKVSALNTLLTNAAIDGVLLRHVTDREVRALGSLKLLPQLLGSPLTPDSLQELLACMHTLSNELMEMHFVRTPLQKQRFLESPFVFDLIRDSKTALADFIKFQKNQGSASPISANLLKNASRLEQLSTILYQKTLANRLMFHDAIGPSLLASSPARTCHVFRKQWDYSPVQMLQALDHQVKLDFAISALPSVSIPTILVMLETLNNDDALTMATVASTLFRDKPTQVKLAMAIETIWRRDQPATNLENAEREFGEQTGRHHEACMAYRQISAAVDPMEIQPGDVVDRAQTALQRSRRKTENKLSNMLVLQAAQRMAVETDPEKKMRLTCLELQNYLEWMERPFPGHSEPDSNVCLNKNSVFRFLKKALDDLPVSTVDEFLVEVEEMSNKQIEPFLTPADKEACTAITRQKKRFDIARQELEAILEQDDPSSTSHQGSEDAVMLAWERYKIERALPEPHILNQMEDVFKRDGERTLLSCLPTMIHANPDPKMTELLRGRANEPVCHLLFKLETQGLEALNEKEQEEYLDLPFRTTDASSDARGHEKQLLMRLVDNMEKLRTNDLLDQAMWTIERFSKDHPTAGQTLHARLLDRFPEIVSTRTKIAILRRMKYSRHPAQVLEMSLAVIRAFRFCAAAGKEVNNDAQGVAYDLFLQSVQSIPLEEKIRAMQFLLAEYTDPERQPARSPTPASWKIASKPLPSGLNKAIGAVMGSATEFKDFVVKGVPHPDSKLSGTTSGTVQALVLTLESGTYALRKADNVYEAAFQALLESLEFFSWSPITSEREQQERVDAIVSSAPLWQDLLKKLPALEIRERHATLALYLDQTLMGNPAGLLETQRSSIRNALEPDETTRNMLLDSLPRLLPAMRDKPVLHMLATRLLQRLASGGTEQQIARADEAIAQALASAPSASHAGMRALDLRSHTSEKSARLVAWLREHILKNQDETSLQRPLQSDHD